LVSLLGTSDKDDGLEGPIEKGFKKYDTRIKAVAAGGAPCEFSWIDKNSRVLAYWLGGSPKQKPKTYRAASPTTFVTADDPAFFFFHQSEYYSAKGNGHLGTFADIRWMEQAIVFFDRHLKAEREDEDSDQTEDSKSEQKR